MEIIGVILRYPMLYYIWSLCRTPESVGRSPHTLWSIITETAANKINKKVHLHTGLSNTHIKYLNLVME